MSKHKGTESLGTRYSLDISLELVSSCTLLGFRTLGALPYKQHLLFDALIASYIIHVLVAVAISYTCTCILCSCCFSVDLYVQLASWCVVHVASWCAVVVEVQKVDLLW